MKITNLPNETRGLLHSPDAAEPAFKQVLIFDHEIARVAAHRIMGRILAGSAPGIESHSDEWSYAEVSHPQIAGETVDLARECDLLILATIKGEEFSEAVGDWLKLWVQARCNKDTALVVLIGVENFDDVTPPVQQQLQNFAQAHGFPLFSSFFPLPVREEAANRQGRGAILSETHQLHYEPRPEGWGINE